MRVAREHGEHRAVATRDLPAGATVCVIDGAEVPRPSRHSIQVDERLHIEVTEPLPPARMMAEHPWRFTNHSCEPNTRLSGRSLVAIRPIAAGEEITFDYNTTEWELAEPFACRCGSPRCIGTVRGFRHVPAAERERLRPLLAPHLLRRLDASAPR